MRFKHTCRILITLLVLVAFAIGSVAVGVFSSRINLNLQTSLITKRAKTASAKVAYGKFAGKRVRRSPRAIIAQLVIPQEIIHSVTVCPYQPPQKPEYKAEFLNAESEYFVAEGEEFEAALYIKNTGNTAWFGDSSHCAETNFIRLGTARERDHGSIFYHPGDPRWLGGNRISMMELRVDPGEIATFRFRSRAPNSTDIFREYFQLMQEGTQWIEGEDTLARIDAHVGQVVPAYENALRYLGKSGQASSLDPTAALTVEIDISEQKMRVKLGDVQIRDYTVSTGTFKTPTPLGRFKILNKQELRIGAKPPHYRMPKWQGFTPWGHGFHALPYLAGDNGTFWEEALSHIGQRVSHGCVRLLPEDSEDLYNITEVGTEIVIHA